MGRSGSCGTRKTAASRVQRALTKRDERGGDPAPPPGRVHEQVFQVDDAAGLEPRGEPDKRPSFFRDPGASLGQPLGPQHQVLRMGQQVVTVTRIRQRRAAMDVGCRGQVGGHAKPDDRHGSPHHAGGCVIRTTRQRSGSSTVTRRARSSTDSPPPPAGGRARSAGRLPVPCAPGRRNRARAGCRGSAASNAVKNDSSHARTSLAPITCADFTVRSPSGKPVKAGAARPAVACVSPLQRSGSWR